MIISYSDYFRKGNYCR